MILFGLAQVANLAVIGSYSMLAFGRWTDRPLHWSNLIGGLALVTIEVLTAAWFVVPLHAAFAVFGAVGVLKGTPQS